MKRVKKKKSIIISRDIEKAFDKIQHPFMLKKKKTLSISFGREFPQPDKRYLQKPTNITLDGERLNAFPSKTGNKARMFTRSTAIKQHTGEAGWHNQVRRIVGIQIGEKEVRLPLFADTITNVKKNQWNPQKKLLELRSDLEKSQDVRKIYQNSSQFKC